MNYDIYSADDRYQFGVPDKITSMFSHDLFVQIYDMEENTPNGTIFQFTVDGVLVDVVMWDNRGRYYFDDFTFNDFFAAGKQVVLGGAIDRNFLLVPKKSIGTIDNADYSFKMLPFFKDKQNVFSTFSDKTIQFEDGTSVIYPEVTKNYITPLQSYQISGTQNPSLIIPREAKDGSRYFEWIDSDGFWRSWYFNLVEIKTNSKVDRTVTDRVIDVKENERTAMIERKNETLTYVFSSGVEVDEVLQILNSIKHSSYVFGFLENEIIQRVNVISEQTSTVDKAREFIFSVKIETKVAL